MTLYMTSSLPVYDTEGNKVSELDLPETLMAPLNPRLISKAFWLLFTHRLQRKGADPYAGERTSAQSWNTGRGVSRVARVKGERSPRAGQAAGVASVVKGRIAHPPKAEKIVRLRINEKEKRAALRSAISAIFDPELVKSRGHMIKEIPVPLLVDDSLQSISKASQLRSFFEKTGIIDDIKRAARRKRRTGKASWRGRSRKVGKGPLIIISKDEGISKAAASFPGVEVVKSSDLSVLHLAPGAVPGRLCIFTKSAFEELKGRLSK